ncbi:hypothetical protein S1OALGB6SA_1244 [Olavius algarvensis spirochete endosymbiont]|uniref:hypothetical protein n=1 Tax=Olavius algarvensis spirochete endosymbiont TaxID=260710 RepID=UPI00052E27DB|nr:hypothetical protein [Olavius algarvensis spirochete endosymbiont]KGM38793.1 hypothetical protein JY97_14645 [Alkalispirochaeta odontotermitis]CAD7845624.1 MAG: hypothetical protein [Olavius algarvensis spirochete endosymbiont]VDB00169.1 hypothetical protein S1OALGB6SA_1244 [Olavius algarvensis spirochete endosymbiont]
MRKEIIGAVVLVSTTAILSCASLKTQQKQYAVSIPLVRSGKYKQASLIIQEAKESTYREKDRVLYYLDLGMLYHWSGEYELSNELLTNAEDTIEELYTVSLSKGIASGLLNDNVLDYPGEDYEDIYLNVFKALNYIALGLTEAALVEIRRVQIKLNLLEDKYRKSTEAYNNSEDAKGSIEFRKSRLHNDALARYIGLLLYRAEGFLDDARIEKVFIDEAWETQKQLYDFPKPTLPTIESPVGEKAIVNFLSFSGLSPAKLADTLRIRTGKDMVYLAITGQSEKYVTELIGFNFLAIPGIKEGIHFKIQFPRLSKRSSTVDRIIVKLDGVEYAELELLESMEKLSEETFRLKQPLRVGKTIIRATLKTVAKEMGKEMVNRELNETDNTGGSIAGFLINLVADIAVDASENADLRVSQFFPASAHIAELMLTPGSYHVTIEYWNSNRLLKEINHGVRDFRSDELNFIESYWLQ